MPARKSSRRSSGGSRSRSGSGGNQPIVVGGGLLAALVAAVLYFLGPQFGLNIGGNPVPTQVADNSQGQPDESQTYPTVPTPPSGATAFNAAKSVPTGPFPQPQEETYKGCPAGGDGTDPELNTLKNRIDSPNAPTLVPFNSLLDLPWPSGVGKKHMAAWSASDRATIAKNNGAPVTVEAYFIRVQQEGAESPNCHATTASDVDYHEWVVTNPADDRTKAVVAEATPRLRAKNPGWTLANFQKLAQSKAKVRITGWLMLDPEHPDQIGQTRGNIWEIHPITHFEVSQNNSWVDLNNLK